MDQPPGPQIFCNFLLLLCSQFFFLFYYSLYFFFMVTSVQEPEGLTIWKGPRLSNGRPHVNLERVPRVLLQSSGKAGQSLWSLKAHLLLVFVIALGSLRSDPLLIPSLLAAILAPCVAYLQKFCKSITLEDKNVVL